MTQTSVAIPPPASVPPATEDNDPLDPLLRLAGDLQTVRALVIAERSLDLLCGLIRRGCLAATAIRPDGKPDADDYGLVVASSKAAEFSPDRLIRQIGGALAPTGRVVASIPMGRPAAAFIRRLRLNGFAVLPPVHLPNLTLLRAKLPVVAMNRKPLAPRRIMTAEGVERQGQVCADW